MKTIIKNRLDKMIWILVIFIAYYFYINGMEKLILDYLINFFIIFMLTKIFYRNHIKKYEKEKMIFDVIIKEILIFIFDLVILKYTTLFLINANLNDLIIMGTLISIIKLLVTYSNKISNFFYKTGKLIIKLVTIIKNKLKGGE
jgi:hypothetical protein